MSEAKKEGKADVVASMSEPVTPVTQAVKPTMDEILSALMAQVSDLAKQVAEMKRPSAVFSGQPVGAPPRVDGINPGFDKVKGYVKQNRGFPVEPGQTWHDLTPAQRNQWFTNHENRWKQKYTERAQNLGGGGQMNWTRG